jgi:imidazolonepropionase
LCEAGAFNPEQARRILLAAQELGLASKVHAEQLSRSGGVQVGVDVEALSVDHCEYVSDDDIVALAESGKTVATLLPGATLFLGMEQWAPGRRLVSAGVPVALSTDSNPGSSNTLNIQLMANLGCTQMGLSVEESLAGITAVAATALDIGKSVGSLTAGMSADLCVLRSPQIEDVVYSFGGNSVDSVMAQGDWVA